MFLYFYLHLLAYFDIGHYRCIHNQQNHRQFNRFIEMESIHFPYNTYIFSMGGKPSCDICNLDKSTLDIT
jgi:hypothetical protein